MRASRFDRVQVVVPARDEERLLGRCLDSVLAAADVVRRSTDCVVAVTVVLDACTDGSDEVLARYAAVEVVRSSAGNVGAARALGLAGLDRGVRTWVACTDADTVVPRTWLHHQLRLAGRGHDLVVGTAQPDPADLGPADLRAWHALHRLAEGHPFVHGANLGFDLAAHDRVGGFAPLATGEDVDLVDRLRADGVSWCATDRTRVTTAGRRRGRAPEGFAGFLHDLHLDLERGVLPPVVEGA